MTLPTVTVLIRVTVPVLAVELERLRAGDTEAETSVEDAALELLEAEGLNSLSVVTELEL